MTSQSQLEKAFQSGSRPNDSDGIPSEHSPLPENREKERFRALCEHLGGILVRVPHSDIRSSLKKSDQKAVAFIFMRFVSILGGSGITLSEHGNEFTVSLEVESMIPKEGPPTT